MKLRKRPAIYALIGVIGFPFGFATVRVFDGTFPGDLAAGLATIGSLAVLLGTFGNKILESEEKGENGNGH